jgi:hypothetical protein
MEVELVRLERTNDSRVRKELISVEAGFGL